MLSRDERWEGAAEMWSHSLINIKEALAFDIPKDSVADPSTS